MENVNIAKVSLKNRCFSASGPAGGAGAPRGRGRGRARSTEPVGEVGQPPGAGGDSGIHTVLLYFLVC